MNGNGKAGKQSPLFWLFHPLARFQNQRLNKPEPKKSAQSTLPRNSAFFQKNHVSFFIYYWNFKEKNETRDKKIRQLRAFLL
jgi:hypothetical protein